MEDIKSDRPEFIYRVFRQLVNDIKDGNNPIPKLKQALQELTSRIFLLSCWQYLLYFVRSERVRTQF
ncbi:MAG TPA: hypothetical protein VFY64_05955 [Nitrososphaeraceae archaeon]|nr:hypothetical protein [Nitrososphaeraceae archaeon]